MKERAIYEKIFIFVFLICALLLFNFIEVEATETSILPKEYTDGSIISTEDFDVVIPPVSYEYREWLELPEEERKKVIMPSPVYTESNYIENAKEEETVKYNLYCQM